MNLLEGQIDHNIDDQNRDFLAELIGPNGKFHDADEKRALQKLAAGKVEADRYVNTLESQLDEMREDLLTWRKEAAARASLEDLVNKLGSNRTGNPDSENNLNANGNQQQSQPTLDTKTLEELVEAKLQKAEIAKKQEQNYTEVFNKVKESLGPNYASILRQQATELGMNDEEVNNLARTNPKLFVKSFGLERKQGSNNFQVPPPGMRSENFTPSTNKRTWSFYQQLRVDNPKAYYDKKTQVQMHKDAYDLGEAFKDGDWSASN